MNLETFLLMRHELMLLVLIIFLIIAEIFSDNDKKMNLIIIAIVMFSVITLLGFIKGKDGQAFGGMFRSNSMIHWFKNILNIGVLIIMLLSTDWIKNKLMNQHKSTEFLILLFSSLLGMYFMISSGDFLMFYLGLELSTLPLAALVAYESSKRISAEAGIKFILSAALASGVSVFGMSLLYATTGTIYFEELKQLLEISNLSIIGLVFLFSGLAFKISLVPFHFWTADVYQGAPISIAAYLSVISKGAAVVILMILFFTVFETFQELSKYLIYGIAIVTMTLGNLFALRQTNLKRLLAFSSIAQAGFILLGFTSIDQLGISTILYFLAIYVFTNLAAFGVVQSVSQKFQKEELDDYNGLYRTNPKLSLVMLLALFSLAGIPPVAGFFGKFFLFTAAASEGLYWLVFIAVINVTISLYYYLIVVRAMFLRKNQQPIPYFKNSVAMKLGLIIAVIGVLLIGVYSPIYTYIYELSNFNLWD